MKGAKGERDKGVPTLPPGGPAYIGSVEPYIPRCILHFVAASAYMGHVGYNGIK